jgi:hypothetical protein
VSNRLSVKIKCGDKVDNALTCCRGPSLVLRLDDGDMKKSESLVMVAVKLGSA